MNDTNLLKRDKQDNAPGFDLIDQPLTHTELVSDLEKLLAAARSRLLRLARSQGVSPDATDDVVQETLVEAWRHLDNLRTPNRFDAWLDGICRNMCLRWSRAQSKNMLWQPSQCNTFADRSDGIEASLVENVPDLEALDPTEELSRQDLSTLFDRALGYLPASAREAIEMYYLAELPQREAAQRLGLTIKALEVRLVRARRQLRQVLSNELRTEAEDFGLVLDQEAATGWRETRIWCMFCGRSYLQGLFVPLPDGRVDLHMRCPHCRNERFKSGGMFELRGLKSFRPALNRVLQVARDYWTSARERQICPYCQAPVEIRLLAHGEALPWLTPWQGLRLAMECPSCGSQNSFYISGALWLHPATQQFMRQHPRWINEPETLVEYAGQPAFRACLTDITSAARLVLLLHTQTMQVLAAHSS